MEAHFYNVNVNWKLDRMGILSSPELESIDKTYSNHIEVATPPEFPKGMPGIWSPEHLLRQQ